MRTVDVNISGHSYKILIDQHLLMGVGHELRHFLKKGKKIGILVSKTVKKLYLERVVRSLRTKGYDVESFLVPSGENNKNLRTVSDLYDQLIDSSFDRSSVIIALGGGITGDVSGFVAATLFRGIPFIQIPTTLLSQVDSSVGGKVGVNHPEGKNLIGSFYQPKIVLIDPTVLKTLDERELVCGFGEILKYGFIQDASLLELCFERKSEILGLRDMELISEIISTSVKIKADIVIQDEKESGVRMLLNFGHTVGHAIEKSCGYGKFLHGEAVILGMCAALKLSTEISGLDMDKANKAIYELMRIKLGHDPAHLDIDSAMNAIRRDKKIRDGKLNFVLLKDIGKPEIVNDVSFQSVEKTLVWLKDTFKRGGKG